MIKAMFIHAIVLALACITVFFVPHYWATFYEDVSTFLLEFRTSHAPAVRTMQKNELSQYTGEVDSPGLYIAILGQVFDVNKGSKHYGPGGGYHFFSGRDGSRAFVTGDFTEAGLTDDVTDLSPSQIAALYDWLAFYQKDYTFVGRLEGYFYGPDGEPTDGLRQAEAALEEGRRLKAQAEAHNQQYPPCNSEWSAAGGRVWCTSKSGGVKRDWVGVPRKLFAPGSTRSRCVCVLQDSGSHDNPNLQEYDGCQDNAISCLVREF